MLGGWVWLALCGLLCQKASGSNVIGGPMTEVAGTTQGYLAWNFPISVSRNGSTFFVVDSENHGLQALDIDGVGYTVFPTSGPGFAQGAPTTALMKRPRGSLYVPNLDVLLIADGGNNAIREIGFDSGAPIMRTIYGLPAETDFAQGHLLWPSAVAMNMATQVMYVTSSGGGHHCIRVLQYVVASDAVLMETICSTTLAGHADGDYATCKLSEPWGLALDEANNILYVADFQNHVIRTVDLDTKIMGTLTGTVGGAGHNDGSLQVAQFEKPRQLYYHAPWNHLFVAEFGCAVRRIYNSAGLGSTGPLDTVLSIVHRSCGADLGVDGRVQESSGVAFDPDSNHVVIADSGNNRIVKVPVEYTAAPTLSPTGAPTVPTLVPTLAPTAAPTDVPTDVPTGSPTAAPTASPTGSPTAAPTAAPTDVPTDSPTDSPTAAPTASPTGSPTASPTASPTDSPTTLTASPTSSPTTAPSSSPTVTPTAAPSIAPTTAPTQSPTGSPTADPTSTPTLFPTLSPTFSPTAVPTSLPSAAPTRAPTVVPSLAPTQLNSVTVVGGGSGTVSLADGTAATVHVPAFADPTVIVIVSIQPTATTHPGVAGQTVSVDLVMNGSVVTGRVDLADPVILELPVSSLHTDECSQPVCGWLNVSTQTWEKTGCVASKPVGGRMNCTCTHLTDFAVLSSESSACALPSLVSYVVALPVYSLLVLYTIVCIIFIVGKTQANHLVVQHVLVCAAATTRLLSCLRFAGYLGPMPDALVAIISALPLVFEVWTFSVLLVTWAVVCHFPMDPGDKAKKLKIAVVCINAVEALGLVVLFIIVVASDASTRQGLALAATMAQALIFLSLALVFVLYSRSLSAMLKTSATLTNGTKKVQQMAAKVLALGHAIALLFVLQTVVSTVAVAVEGSGPDRYMTLEICTAVYLLFDAVALVALLLLYVGGLKARAFPSSKSTKSSKGFSQMAGATEMGLTTTD